MKVLDTRVIVQLIKDEEACTKIGDFVLPEENLAEYDKAKVIEVGPKVEDVAKGDTVYIYRGCGKEFKVDGIKYKTISSGEIIVVL